MRRLKSICGYPHPIQFDDNLNVADSLPQLNWMIFCHKRSRFKNTYIPNCIPIHPISWFKSKKVWVYRIKPINWRKKLRTPTLKEWRKGPIPLNAFK